MGLEALGASRSWSQACVVAMVVLLLDQVVPVAWALLKLCFGGWVKRYFYYRRWRREVGRRVLSRTIFNEMIGFADSQLNLGEEEIQPGEGELTARILTILERRHLRDFPPGVRPMLRDFHGKAHGTVRASFRLEPDLPSEVRFGCFAAAAGTQYDAVVRFSNASRVAGSDRQQNQRGMAIKLIVGDQHQDFLLSDFPVNFMADVYDAYEFYRAEAADRPLAFFLRHLDKFAITLIGSAFRQPRDVFDLEYFSQTPYKLGPKACKYIAKPASADAGPDIPSNIEDNPDFLRERMETRLLWSEQAVGTKHEDARRIRFDFFIQPQRSPVRQPIEDASFEWREDEAVPIKVGTVTLHPEWSPSILSSESRWHAELLSFNPEHAHADLRPLGGLNRVRRAVYEKFAQMRFRANNVKELEGRAAFHGGALLRRPAHNRTQANRKE